MRPLDDGPGILDRLFDRFGNFDRIFEQADSSLTVARLVAISGIMFVVGALLSVIVRMHVGLAPCSAAGWRRCPWYGCCGGVATA